MGDTNKQEREIENYLHPDAVFDEFGVRIEINDQCDVPLAVAMAVHAAAADAKPWNDLDEEKIGQKVSRAKRRLCDKVAGRMTREQFEAADQAGDISSWFGQIAARLHE